MFEGWPTHLLILSGYGSWNRVRGEGNCPRASVLVYRAQIKIGLDQH